VTALAGVLVLTAACGGAEPSASATTGTSSEAATSPSTTSTTTRPKPSTSRTSEPAPSGTTERPAPTATAAPRPKAKPKPATALAPVPRAGAEPPVRFPRNDPAVGSGANPAISSIPDSVWGRMVGYSWTEGCPVGRAALRYVTVNFWGFDGLRSRGALVVHRDIAESAAGAFAALYEQRFRIRQMKPMDSTWGKNPKGPGANDYAAMEADNTSAFNCRYVGGEEVSKKYSNHAYGRAIDVNDFENPYVDSAGRVYPDSYYLHRRGPAPGVFSGSGSAAVRAFSSRGFSWGGLWSAPDYQHFDR
jgi:hypothetical protein